MTETQALALASIACIAFASFILGWCACALFEDIQQEKQWRF